MKYFLPVLVTGLLTLPLAATAGSEEFYTPIPSTGSVNGWLDYDGADPDKREFTVTNTDVSPNPYTGATWAGQFQGYFSTVKGDVAEGDNLANLFFRFFCVDLYQPTTESRTAYSASQYSNSNMQKLYDVAYPNEQMGDFYNGSKTSFGQFVNDVTYSAMEYSTAFQLSVWELLYEKDETHSLNTGNFTNNSTAGTFMFPDAASNAHAIANQWLSQVDNYTGAGYQNWQLYGFVSGSKQDYVSATYAVPEPSSLLLAGLGLAGLALTMRRRRNQM